MSGWCHAGKSIGCSTRSYHGLAARLALLSLPQLPSWHVGCEPWWGYCISGRSQAWLYELPKSVVLFTGLPLTMPNPGAFSFMPVFSGPHGGPDPVSTAMSQVGLPTSVCGQTAIVPVINPALPPAADPVGGAMALPEWGSVPPRLVKKILALEFIDMWELLPESWRLESTESGCCNPRRPRRGLVTIFPLWVECYASLVAILAARYRKRHPISWRT